MIRHRPFGRGHPYLVEPDQRLPAQPVAGEPLQLRATTDSGISELRLELQRGDRYQVLAATRATFADADATSPVPQAATHLSAAASGKSYNRRPAWHVMLEGLQPGERLRYRFVGSAESGEQQRTRWHDVTIADWQAGGGRLQLELVASDEAARRAVAVRLVPESIRCLVADGAVHRIRFALRLTPSEHIVGFGERFNALDQRGHRLDAVVFEQYKQQGTRTYLPMPFAIAVGGRWGFHVATSRRVSFDVAATDADRLWIDVDLDPEANPAVTLELFAGTPAEVLASFLDRTGRPPLPPDWVFGPWMSSNEWNSQARVLAEVERSEREGIPVSAIVIEAWSDESTFTAFRDAEYPIHTDGSPHALADYTFRPDGAWPDPKAMIDELHARGIRVLLWQIPLLKARPTPQGQLRYDRETLVERGYAVRQADGRPYANCGWWFPGALLPDFTSDEARAWWIAKRRYLAEELGVDGFKTDGGEHAWGHDLRYADGSRGSETNNRYPLLYAAAYHELFSTLGHAGVTFSRAGFTGSAAYPCHWAGDEDSSWEAFRASITAGLTAGASGIFFWGWDLGGFSGEIPTAELYLRAAAMACLCPIMQYHSEYNHHRKPSRDRTPWNIAERTGEARVLPTYRRFAQLRMRLVPYLSAQARKAIEESKPLMRALFFEVADDPRIWDFPYQYFLGDDMLVAPVTVAGVEGCDVYFPPGTWVDPWTREELTGPAVVERPAPLDEIPVFVSAARAASLANLFDEQSNRRPKPLASTVMEVS